MVYAANADILEVALKPVLETYVRKTSTLVHITVNGEEKIPVVEKPESPSWKQAVKFKSSKGQRK